MILEYTFSCSLHPPASCTIIGDSDLVPVIAYEALKPNRRRNLTVRFVSNADGTHMVEAVCDLDAGGNAGLRGIQDLLTTQKTMPNAETAKA